MGQRPYGLHPGHRHVPPRFPLREIGGTDMGTLAINKGRHSAKAGNWRRAKRARISSIFSSRHPSPPTNRNGGRGSKSREKVQSLSFQPSFWREGSSVVSRPRAWIALRLRVLHTHAVGATTDDTNHTDCKHLETRMYPVAYSQLDLADLIARRCQPCHTPPGNGIGRPTGVLTTPPASESGQIAESAFSANSPKDLPVRARQ